MYNSAGGYTDNFYCLFTDNKKEKIILKFLGYFEWMVNYSICRTENIKNVMNKFIDFTQNIWINEITTEALGQKIYKRCRIFS